jgi:hypothetical protein
MVRPGQEGVLWATADARGGPPAGVFGRFGWALDPEEGPAG